MMDFQAASVLSLAETLICAFSQGKLHETQLPTQALLSQFLFYFTIQYCILKFYRIILYPRSFSPLRHIPGPTNNFPLIGQFKHIVSSCSPSSVFLEWSARWPNEPFIRYLGPLNKEILLVNTPEAHKEVLMTHCYSFRKPSLFRHLVEDITGPGSLLFSEEHESKRYRKILSEPFSVPKLKVVFSVFQEKADLLAEYFEKNLDENGEGVFDVARLNAKMGLDVAGLTLLGLELKNLNSSDPKYDFSKDYKRIFQPSKFSSVVSFINSSIPIRKFLPIDTSYLHAIARIRRGVTECVHNRMRDIDESEARGEKFSTATLPNGGRDLLTLIIDQRRNFKGSSDELSIQEMVDQLVTFLPAGHETIAGAMTWASYILCTNPEVQDKLRADIFTLFNSKHQGEGEGGRPSWNDIDRLPYVNNFSKEIIRLYPTATISYREAKEDITICGRFLPKGTPLHFVWAVPCQSKAVWGPDADKVVPERWEKLQGRCADPYAWQSFASGPRFCIGKNYALMEMKAFLVAIVSRFRFEKSEELEALGGRHPPYYSPALTLWPKGGMKVVLKKL